MTAQDDRSERIPIKGVEYDHTPSAPLPKDLALTLTGQAQGTAGIGLPPEATISAFAFMGLPGTVGTDTELLTINPGYGVGISKYASPILIPGLTTAAALLDLSPELVAFASFTKAIGVSDPGPANLVALRVFRVLIPREDGARGYEAIDLADPTVIGQALKVHANGAIEYSVRGVRLISPDDGIFINLIYAPDRGRIDTSRVVAVCSLNPPSPSAPIRMLELETPMLPTASAVDGWYAVRPYRGKGLIVAAGSYENSPAPISGTRQIEAFGSIWTYAFDASKGFRAHCAPVGKPDERRFFELDGSGKPPFIKPLRYDQFDVRALLAGARRAHDVAASPLQDVSGVVLYDPSQPDPKHKIIRASLTNLDKLGRALRFEDGLWIVRDPDGSERAFQPISLRSKADVGFAPDTGDGYAVRNGYLGERAAATPHIGHFGDFDIVVALKAAEDAGIVI